MPGYLAELTTKAEAVRRQAIAKKKDDPRAFSDWIDRQFRPTATRSLRRTVSGPKPTRNGRSSGPGMAPMVRLRRTGRLSSIEYRRPS